MTNAFSPSTSLNKFLTHLGSVSFHPTSKFVQLTYLAKSHAICPILPLASLTDLGEVTLQYTSIVSVTCNILLQPAAGARLHIHPCTWLQTSYSLTLPGFVSVPQFLQSSNIPRIVQPRAGQYRHKCSETAPGLRTTAGIIFLPLSILNPHSVSQDEPLSCQVRDDILVTVFA